MVQTAEEFLHTFTRNDLKHIAINLDIDFDSRTCKNDLIELIISDYFPDGELDKRRIKKILNMFYKYVLTGICKKMGGYGFSRLNTEELHDYIVEICFYEDDDEYDYEESEDFEEEDYFDSEDEDNEHLEEHIGDYDGYTPEVFLKLFVKNDLEYIAYHLDLEYDSPIRKSDLIELIASNHFPKGCLEEENIEIILDMFYKYQLKNIFGKIIEKKFFRLNTQELMYIIIEYFVSNKAEGEVFEEDAEDVFEEFGEEHYVDKFKVLIAGAQPVRTDNIELMRELEMMKNIIRSNPLFRLIPRYSTSIDNFMEDLSYFKPDLLHLTAHGNKGEILFEDERGEENPRKIEVIAEIIRIHNKDMNEDSLFGIILSSCHSEHDAVKLTKSVEFVIAMSDAIYVDSAIEFAEGFYSGIKLGKSIQDAFEMGRALIVDKKQKGIPQLLPKNKDFNQLRLNIFQ